MSRKLDEGGVSMTITTAAAGETGHSPGQPGGGEDEGHQPGRAGAGRAGVNGAGPVNGNGARGARVQGACRADGNGAGPVNGNGARGASFQDAGRVDAGWAERVRRLADERDAVILAHNYQVPEIQ